MLLFRHALLAVALIFIAVIHADSAYAKCKISSAGPTEAESPDAVGGTPPLCKGRTNLANMLSATTGEPDFSDNDDILDGFRDMLPVDDLVMMNPTAKNKGEATSTPTTIQNFYFLTNDKQVTDYIVPPVIDTAPCSTNGPANPYPFGMPSPQQTQVLRMFDLDRDVVVTYAANQNADPDQCLGLSTKGNRNISITVDDPMGEIFIPVMTLNTLSVYFIQSAGYDFNGDGYDDMLIMSGDYDPIIFVISAVDPDDPGLGVKISSITSISNSQSAMSSPVVGDFNGDTIPDVAWVGSRGTNDSTYNIFFASICPGPTENVALCQGRQEFEVILNPLSSQQIPLDTFINSSKNWAYPASSLAAGNFDDNPDQSAGDDLVVIYGQADVKGYDIEYYTFSSVMVPTLRSYITKDSVKLTNVFAEGAQLDRTLLSDQVVAAVRSETDENCYIWALSFDGADMFFTDTKSDVGCVSDVWQLNGLAVGRFTDEEPNNAIELSSQAAVLFSRYNTGTNHLRIQFYEFDLLNFYKPFSIGESASSDKIYRSSYNNQDFVRGGSFLKAGDLQGRSALLGTPDVARITNWLQVNTILGSPPMHTDYIQGLGQSGPVVNNMSVTPVKFNTSYTTQTSSTTDAVASNNTSWTFSFEQSSVTKVNYPVYPGVGIMGSLSLSANETYDCNVSTVNSSYSSKTFGLSTETRFGDLIFYTESRQNIYFYPVIGQEVCIDGSADCLDSEKAPLVYEIAAPDQICREAIDGRTAEFYQPVHQPGEIFSYPPNRTQLLQRFSTNVEQIQTDPNPVGFFTNNNPETQYVNWEQGEGSKCTTDTTETISGKESLSVTFGAGDLKTFGSGGFSQTFAFSFAQSQSINTQQTQRQSTTDSTGIQVHKNDEFLNPDNYKYLIKTYIMGEPLPDGTWQAQFTTADTADIENTGALIAAFTADMTTLTSGAWWQSGGINPYRQYPDIALNHPTMWRDVPVKTASIEEQPTYCRLEGFASDKLTCTLISKPATTETELWSSTFYWMRGLFVQVGDEAVGPAQSIAYFGDDLHISARVYNYSLKAMNPGDAVHVQFYRQQWNPTLNVPIGGSTLIDEVVTSAIPPFTSAGEPNWKAVTIDFNTEDEGMGIGTYWIFWVLVTGVDSQGNLITEVPGHGLDSASYTPGDVFSSILDVPLEMVTINELNQDVDRSFTNNVGFFKHAFYIASPIIPQGARPEPEINIENLRVIPDTVKVGESATVEADIRSQGAETFGAAVLFHDDHPDVAKMAFDIEMLSHIDADGTDNVKVSYMPEFCGQHELYVSAGDNGACNLGADMMSVTLNVPCEEGDTNRDGQLIGPDGQPLPEGSVAGGCTLAQPGGGVEIPVALFLPLFVFIFRFIVKRFRHLLS